MLLACGAHTQGSAMAKHRNAPYQRYDSLTAPVQQSRRPEAT